MKCELKNVKIASNLSRETIAFAASLWIDGKKAADYHNDGNGGCNIGSFDDPKLGKQFHKWCESLPADKSKYGDLPMNEDLFISLLVEDYENQRWVKSQTRTKIIFRLKGDGEGSWRTLKVSKGQDRGAARKWIDDKYKGKVEVLHG